MPAYPIKIIKQISKGLWKSIIYIDVDIPIRNRKRVPNHSGVYILINRLGERYIGSSINILDRQRCHIIKSAIKIDVFLIEDIMKARVLEQHLIYKLNPELNKCTQNEIVIESESLE